MVSMEKPRIPANEEQRLAVLRELRLLDTAFEERFDRLTRIAARAFDVPIALVSLVDQDRQWFKAAEGLDVRETPRDISFCGHTILDNEVFVVSDTHADARFVDNPLVTGDPNIRFYAGCPLQVDAQNRIGTLCIIDSKPRKFSEADVKLLQDFTVMVQQELWALQSATIDELTSIPNRRGFKMLAEHNLKICARHAMPATLVFLDLDDFKSINDTYGHENGDHALILMAEHMRQRFRKSDICARLAGDEFVVLLTNTDCAMANEILPNFQQSLGDAVRESEWPFQLSFSFGATEYDPSRHGSLEALLGDCDREMYDAKRQRH